MSNEDTRTTLERQRARLRQRLDQIHADYRRGLDADSQEQAIQLENADTLAEIARVTEQQLRDVESRLAALDDGEGRQRQDESTLS